MQQIMSCGVAVYPDFEIPGEMERTCAYLRSARALGYGEVFTSLHIPERDVSGVLGELAALGEFVHRCGMEFTLDASGNVMNGFLDDPEKFALLREIPMDWLRMDFGFDPESIRRMVGMLSLKGLMCNASMLSAEEVRELVRMTEAWDGLKLRAHHNFYPRPETGLSMEFLCAKSKPYLPYDIPVTACIPGFQNPRQPLFAGLPTVERHRRMCAGDASRLRCVFRRKQRFRSRKGRSCLADFTTPARIARKPPFVPKAPEVWQRSEPPFCPGKTGDAAGLILPLTMRSIAGIQESFSCCFKTCLRILA